MIHKEAEQRQEQPGVGERVLSKAGVQLLHGGEDSVREGATDTAQDVQQRHTLVETLGWTEGGREGGRGGEY